MYNKGVYILWLYLAQETRIEIGKLGSFTFGKGVYAYIGSAQRNLKQRIARHRRLDKKFHWHIDYFRAQAKFLAATYFLNQPKIAECEITLGLIEILEATVPVQGFGSSDCLCPSHFLHLPQINPQLLSIFLRDAVHSVDLSATELLAFFDA